MAHATSLSLVTERLELRTFELIDIPRIHAALYASEQARRLTGGVWSLAETEATIERYIECQALRGYAYWAVVERDTGDLVGEAGLKPLGDDGPEVELGYAFTPASWGVGYATEAGRATLGHAWSALGLKRVVAVTRDANAGSRRVLEKLAFVARGRRRIYGGDLLYFELERPAQSGSP